MQKIARSAQDLGHILRQYRRKSEMSQTDLAQRTQTHQRLISRLETGNKGRTLDVIFDVMRALDLEIEIRPRRKGTAQDIEDIFS